MSNIKPKTLALIKASMSDLLRHNPILCENLQKIDHVNLNANQFYSVLKSFLQHFEGCKRKAYDDSNGRTLSHAYKPRGNPTIGIGCNLNIYAEALPKILNQDRSIIERVLSGSYSLSDEEINAIFQHCIIEQAQNLFLNHNSLYFHLWGYFPPSLKLVLSSLYFNAGNNLVGRKSTIYRILYSSKNIAEIMMHLFNIGLNISESKKALMGLAYRRCIEGMTLYFGFEKI